MKDNISVGFHVIHIVGSLAPETGGPARSVPNLAVALADLGVKVSLLVLDFGDKFSSPLIPVHNRITFKSLPIKVSLGMKPLYFPGFNEALKQLISPDKMTIIHDHGIWLPQNFLVSRYSQVNQVPLIISPRGMLTSWSFNYHLWKKLPLWHIYQRRNLQLANAIHTTSQDESIQLKRLKITTKTAVIPNGTIIPPVHSRKTVVKNEKLKLLFLSRIHQKKGIPDLIKALSLINSTDWELTVAGYDENNYLSQVKEICQGI